MIHAIDRGAGIVHGGRDGFQRDVDNLQDAELNVLLEGSGSADVDGLAQVDRGVGREPVRFRQQRRGCRRNELTHSTNQADLHMEDFGKRDQASRIDEADIAGTVV